MEKKKFTTEMVDDYANKVLIDLTREENKKVLDEFEEIEKQFDLLNEIPGLASVEPMSWCLDRTIDDLREDVVEESTSIDDALSNCDNENGYEVIIPKVVG